MIITTFGINDMESFFAALKAFFDERQQEMILLFGGAEESADVTMRAQLRAGEANGLFLFSTNDVQGGVLSVLRRLVPRTKSPISVRQRPITNCHMFVAFVQAEREARLEGQS